jgi:uncharacterized protein (DUF4415 family)
MNANKHESQTILKSNLMKIDSHRITDEEYDDLPELTDEMLQRATVNKGGRPISKNPKKLISLRVPLEVLERWKATGPGWQTRMVAKLSDAA